jgi:2-C-methyl-D-erythritol 4-phosphate cytidylyltransferase/2-C-methyl-D-erythritol 2,4-cyclodiphosphate synthase
LSIVEHSLRAIFSLADEVQVIVVAPSTHLDPIDGAIVVSGGATRQQSVAAGLAVLHDSIQTVLVHDAARAFTPTEQFDRVIRAVESTGGGVIPGLAVTDTIKRVDADRAGETIDRSELVAVQTPQGFPRALLVAAYAAATEEYTDDAALFAAAGHPVTVVAGDPEAFKITTPWDLRRAELLVGEVSASSTSAVRVGTGIDVHAYDDTSELWLGGLHWPGERGLAGHSDGDVLCHAICDALLSAAGLGDIGSRFGTADPRFENAHGEVFVSATVELLRAAGYVVSNVSAQVIAVSPKIGPRRDEVQSLLSAWVGAPVSVSATTSDGLGFTGRGDGIAVIATALVERTQ